MLGQSKNKISEIQNGLDFLTEKFESLAKIPTLPDICGWLAEAEFTEAEMNVFRHFNEEKYTRNKIFRNDFVELLVLGWLPGQETLIHDHDGSHGVVRIFEGTITETKYRFDDERKIQVNIAQDATEGMLAGVGEPDIHKLGNNSAKTAISIHVYAPPLKGMNIYEVGSGENWFYKSE